MYGRGSRQCAPGQIVHIRPLANGGTFSTWCDGATPDVIRKRSLVLVIRLATQRVYSGLGAFVYRPSCIKRVVRPCISTAVAFALALQALLSSVLSTQAAAPVSDARHWGIICLSDGTSDENEGKADQALHECCVLCESSTGLTDRPRAARTIAPRRFSSIRYGAVLHRRFSRPIPLLVYRKVRLRSTLNFGLLFRPMRELAECDPCLFLCECYASCR